MVTSSGNPFGHGIHSREGSPIQLVRYEKNDSDEFGKIYVVPEALKILQRIKEPVAVIAVGKYQFLSMSAVKLTKKVNLDAIRIFSRLVQKRKVMVRLHLYLICI